MRSGRSATARVMGLGIVSAACLAGVLGGCDSKPAHLISQSYELGDLRASGNEAFATGDYARAATLYQAYVDQRPQEAAMQYQLGRTMLAMGEAEGAREHLKIAYDLDPGNQDYIDVLARSILLSGSREEALEFLEAAAEGNMNAEGFMTLGYYAREAGFIDEAEAAYKRAVALGGFESAEPHRQLASFYRSVGDSQSEVERLRVVLSFDADDERANERLRDLGEIPGPTFALEPTAID
ncbi:MAG: tetratricopeptide repeat protein [Phycisphaerales bacterium]